MSDKIYLKTIEFMEELNLCVCVCVCVCVRVRAWWVHVWLVFKLSRLNWWLCIATPFLVGMSFHIVCLQHNLIYYFFLLPMINFFLLPMINFFLLPMIFFFFFFFFF